MKHQLTSRGQVSGWATVWHNRLQPVCKHIRAPGPSWTSAAGITVIPNGTKSSFCGAQRRFFTACYFSFPSLQVLVSLEWSHSSQLHTYWCWIKLSLLLVWIGRNQEDQMISVIKVHLVLQTPFEKQLVCGSDTHSDSWGTSWTQLLSPFHLSAVDDHFPSLIFILSRHPVSSSIAVMQLCSSPPHTLSVGFYLSLPACLSLSLSSSPCWTQALFLVQSTWGKGGFFQQSLCDWLFFSLIFSKMCCRIVIPECWRTNLNSLRGRGSVHVSKTVWGLCWCLWSCLEIEL